MVFAVLSGMKTGGLDSLAAFIPSILLLPMGGFMTPMTR